MVAAAAAALLLHAPPDVPPDVPGSGGPFRALCVKLRLKQRRAYLDLRSACADLRSAPDIPLPHAGMPSPWNVSAAAQEEAWAAREAAGHAGPGEVDLRWSPLLRECLALAEPVGGRCVEPRG